VLIDAVLNTIRHLPHRGIHGVVHVLQLEAPITSEMNASLVRPYASALVWSTTAEIKKSGRRSNAPGNFHCSNLLSPSRTRDQARHHR
jgi:hypothetical protein